MQLIRYFVFILTTSEAFSYLEVMSSLCSSCTVFVFFIIHILDIYDYSILHLCPLFVHLHTVFHYFLGCVRNHNMHNLLAGVQI